MCGEGVTEERGVKVVEDGGERQESVRFHGPPSAGSSLVDEAQFEPSGQSAVVSVAVVAVVVGVAIMDGIVCIFRVGD